MSRNQDLAGFHLQVRKLRVATQLGFLQLVMLIFFIAEPRCASSRRETMIEEA